MIDDVPLESSNLIDLADIQVLKVHPVLGASRDAYVVEQVAAAVPPGAQLSYYRTAAGSELDGVVEAGGRRLGIEVKFSAAPKPTRGFWQSLQDLRIAQSLVVAPVARGYPIAAGAEVVPVSEAVERVRALGEGVG